MPPIKEIDKILQLKKGYPLDLSNVESYIEINYQLLVKINK